MTKEGGGLEEGQILAKKKSSARDQTAGQQDALQSSTPKNSMQTQWQAGTRKRELRKWFQQTKKTLDNTKPSCVEQKFKLTGLRSIVTSVLQTDSGLKTR